MRAGLHVPLLPRERAVLAQQKVCWRALHLIAGIRSQDFRRASVLLSTSKGAQPRASALLNGRRQRDRALGAVAGDRARS